MPIETLAAAGGIFALLTFAHFVIDWGFQSHEEAMKKSTDWRWRAWHCSLYAIGFIPVLLLFQLSLWEVVAAWTILFVSHFIEDTYIPVYLWAKHIRRMPELQEGGIEAFKQKFKEPLGLVLFLTIDQLIHLAFLLPIVWFALTPN
jgi:hypothetical protein